MPSLPITNISVGLTALKPISGQVTWTAGNTELRIRERGLPDFLVRVNREVQKISVSCLECSLDFNYLLSPFGLIVHR